MFEQTVQREVSDAKLFNIFLYVGQYDFIYIFFGDETSVLVIHMLILSPLLFLVVALLSRKNLEVSVIQELIHRELKRMMWYG